MTFDEYKVEVETAMRVYPAWRWGQAAFNVLCRHRPDLSEQIRATNLDPFHISTKVPVFYSWVRQHWDDTATQAASDTGEHGPTQ